MVIGASCRDIGRSIEKTINEYSTNFEHRTKLQEANNPDWVPKKAKDAIITEALSCVKHQTAENDYYSLYTCEQSERGHERARLKAQRDTTNRPSRLRSSSGRLKSSQYDEEITWIIRGVSTLVPDTYFTGNLQKMLNFLHGRSYLHYQFMLG